MRKAGLTFITFSLLVFSSFIQVRHNDYNIKWQESRPLSWDDFQSMPDYGQENFSAMTSSGIEYSTSCNNGNMIISINPFFEKERSWVKPEALTAYHLAHEQLHFDITELFARKMRMQIDNYAFKCSDGKKLEKVMNRLYLEWESMQINYDAHTDHSLNEEEQMKWDGIIQRELDNFAAYKTIHLAP